MFVFLTVEGDEASDEDWVSYSYADIHRVLDRVRRTSGSSIGGDVLTFLDHYLNLLGSRFMDDAKLDELCRRIYQNHRRAIDLITERIGSREREIVNHMASIVETDSQAYRVFWRSKDAVGFIPAIWLDALPAIARANSRDKRVWFSLYFGLRQSHGRLAVYFSIWITPTTNDRSRTKLVEALVDQSERLQLLPRPRSRPPYRNTPVHEELVVTFDDVDSVDLDLLAERVRQTMRSTTDRVSSIATILRALAREDPNRDDA
jgi:hypothetical protein